MSPAVRRRTSIPVPAVKAANVPSETQNESWVTRVTGPMGGSSADPSPELSGTDVMGSVPPQADPTRTASTRNPEPKAEDRARTMGSPFAGITRSRFWSGRQRPRRWRRSLPSQPGIRPELPGWLSSSRLPVNRCGVEGPKGTKAHRRSSGIMARMSADDDPICSSQDPGSMCQPGSSREATP